MPVINCFQTSVESDKTLLNANVFLKHRQPSLGAFTLETPYLSFSVLNRLPIFAGPIFARNVKIAMSDKR